MAQQVRFRPQGRISYESGARVSMQLGRGLLYRELYLKLSGQLTVALANNTQAKTKAGDEWAAVSRVEVIANNTDVIRSFTGEELWWLNYYYYGVTPRITSTLGDGATDNPSFDVSLIIPFWTPRTVRPIDTLLDARQLANLEVVITWGSHTSINADATGWTTEPYIEVGSCESFGIDGSFAGSRIHRISETISSASTDYSKKLTVGPMYRGFILNAKNSSGVDTAGLLNNIKLISGPTVFFDQTEVFLRDIPNLRMSMQRNHSSGASGAYQEFRRSSSSKADAWYFLDLVTDGRLSECIDTAGFAEFEFRLNVDANTTLTILPMQIIPIRR